MKRDYIEFQDRSVALGYLITFRCYGTWLHGDERGTVDRRFHNIFGSPKMAANEAMRATNTRMLKGEPFVLDAEQRSIVATSIDEVCRFRGYSLFASHVRTNHVHIATGNSDNPERMMDTFKAYATRALRKAGRLDSDAKAWSRHGSTRYLWTEEHIEMAVDYVLNGQGGELPKFK